MSHCEAKLAKPTKLGQTSECPYSSSSSSSSSSYATNYILVITFIVFQYLGCKILSEVCLGLIWRIHSFSWGKCLDMIDRDILEVTPSSPYLWASFHPHIYPCFSGIRKVRKFY
jgi:hypothetical protein